MSYSNNISFMKNTITFPFLLISFVVLGQKNTGQNIFNSLNHPSSARITAMGGNLVGLYDNDIALAWQNPAILNKDMSGSLSINYDRIFAGIGSGYAAYAKHIDKVDLTFQGGIQYLNYGSFDATDEYANAQGTFKGQDMAFGIGAAKTLSDNWSIGLNLKMLFSALENYTASGLASDIGFVYHNQEKRSSFGISATNLGVQLGTYTNGNRARLPLNIQLGYAKKLKHLPFQYTITYRNLETWNVTYKDPSKIETTDIFGQPIKQTSKFVQNLDNFARHLSVGGEFLLGKKENFRLRLGYTHLQRREMSVAPYRSLTGFSFGFGFKLKRFSLDLGRNTAHMAGGMTHFSFATKF
jgi:hypothetical protein